MGARNCRLLKPEILEASFSSIDTVLFDLDGVLWRGGHVLPGAVEVIETLLRHGKRVGYVTNNSSRTSEQTIQTLNQRGFATPEPDLVLATARSTALYVSKRKKNGRAFMLGNKAIATELERCGISVWSSELHENLLNLRDDSPVEVDAIVCGLDREFNYNRLSIAGHLLHVNKDALFVATNLDPTFPEAGGKLGPGCGSVIAAIETVGCRKADVVIGKPYSLMFDQISEQLNLDGKRTLMVGDRCDTDMGFATAIGGPSLFVETGAETLEEAKQYTKEGAEHPGYAPTFYLPSVNDLDQMIKQVIEK